jgi:hypothetical protein
MQRLISLCIGLFSVMVLQLRSMFLSLLPPLDFQAVTTDILFLLILVELFRLLIIYLQEQRVSIGVAVEVAIVCIVASFFDVSFRFSCLDVQMSIKCFLLHLHTEWLWSDTTRRASLESHR